MHRVSILKSSWLVCAGLALLGSLAAQAQSRDDCERNFQPHTGQAGKDVIWVPTNDALVERMLRLANTRPNDVVYDLGAGDGKIAIAAAKKFGARSVGVEYDENMVRFAQCLVQAEGVSEKTRIVQGDIFEVDFSEATVVTLYLLPELNLRLRPTLLQMKPGTRVVSHSFLMDDWEPDDRSTTEDGYAYLWIVPAQVQGTWTFSPQAKRGDAKHGEPRFVAELEQTFQNLRGRVGAGKAAQEITEAKIDGANIRFSFPDGHGTAHLVGKMNGTRIDAIVTDGRNQRTRYVGTRS